MDRRTVTTRTTIGFELQQALNEWLAASRRAYVAPTPAHREEIEERAAWRRLQFALTQSESVAA